MCISESKHYVFDSLCAFAKNCRLGGVLPGKLYLTRFDEFGNPKEFKKIPSDLACDLYSTEGRIVKISAIISKDHLAISDDERLSLKIPV